MITLDEVGLMDLLAIDHPIHDPSTGFMASAFGRALLAALELVNQRLEELKLIPREDRDQPIQPPLTSFQMDIGTVEVEHWGPDVPQAKDPIEIRVLRPNGEELGGLNWEVAAATELFERQDIPPGRIPAGSYKLTVTVERLS